MGGMCVDHGNGVMETALSDPLHDSVAGGMDDHGFHEHGLTFGCGPMECGLKCVINSLESAIFMM